MTTNIVLAVFQNKDRVMHSPALSYVSPATVCHPSDLMLMILTCFSILFCKWLELVLLFCSRSSIARRLDSLPGRDLVCRLSQVLKQTQFSDIVKYTQIRDPTGLPDAPATRALLAAQALRFVAPGRRCPLCTSPYKLCFKAAGCYGWTEVHYDSQGCPDCLDQRPYASAIGFLANVK